MISDYYIGILKFIIGILPIIISLLALYIAYYSLLANTEPVIVFIHDDKNDWYYLKNVGKGPALNIIVTYAISENGGWINPVLCYSVESNGTVDVNWGLKQDGSLFSKTKDKGSEKGPYLGGVYKIAAIYSSSNHLKTKTYTSICQSDKTIIFKGTWIIQSKDENIERIWNLERKPQNN